MIPETENGQGQETGSNEAAAPYEGNTQTTAVASEPAGSGDAGLEAAPEAQAEVTSDHVAEETLDFDGDPDLDAQIRELDEKQAAEQLGDVAHDRTEKYVLWLERKNAALLAHVVKITAVARRVGAGVDPFEFPDFKDFTG